MKRKTKRNDAVMRLKEFNLSTNKRTLFLIVPYKEYICNDRCTLTITASNIMDCNDNKDGIHIP